MAARSEHTAANANGRAVFARFPIREFAAILGVVFTAVGVLIAGMQWAVSNSFEPLHLSMQGMHSELKALRGDIAENRAQIADLRTEVSGLRGEFGGLRGEVEGLRTEVAENRAQIVDLRERVAKVETGLEQVQANQVRILDILERGPHSRE